jgi:hypothetical protein
LGWLGWLVVFEIAESFTSEGAETGEILPVGGEEAIAGVEVVDIVGTD